MRRAGRGRGAVRPHHAQQHPLAGLWFRNQVIRTFAVPGVARLVAGRDIVDALRLPNYEWPFLEEIQSAMTDNGRAGAAA